MFDKKEKEILIELICNEQTHMIIENPESYNSSKYQELEKLKVKIKDDYNNTINKCENKFNPVTLLEIEIPFGDDEINNAIEKILISKQEFREYLMERFKK